MTRARIVATAMVVAAALTAAPGSGAFERSASPRPATVEPAVAAELARSGADDVLAVGVHGDTAAAAHRALRGAGLEVVEAFDRFGIVWAAGTPAEVRAVHDQPGVVRVEANRALDLHLDTAHRATRADDARTPALGLLDGAGRPFDGSGVTIAVVDTGVDATHPFFDTGDGTTKVRLNMRQACAVEVCDAWVEVADSDAVALGGHGTHVAGIAAGHAGESLFAGQVRGAAPGADLVGLGLGASNRIFNAASGLQWVLDHHHDPCGDGSCPPIRVVNNSWGTTGPFDPTDTVNQVVSALVAEGVVVTFSAGNGSGDGSADRVNTYAKNPLPGVVSVANYNDGGQGHRDGVLSGSSSRGLDGDPATYPDLAAPGSSILSSCRAWHPICGVRADPDYATLSGTSMAAPYVAGVVAILLQAEPDLSPAEVEDLLEDTAHPFSAGAAYEPDPLNADSDTSFDKGHGLVDVVALLAAALDRTPDDADPCASPGATCLTEVGDTLSYSGATTAGVLSCAYSVPSCEARSVEVRTPEGGGALVVELQRSGGDYTLRVTGPDGNAEVGTSGVEHQTVTLVLDDGSDGGTYQIEVIPFVAVDATFTVTATITD